MIAQRWNDDRLAPSAVASNASISIVLIHDSRVVREGVALLINSQPKFRLVSAAADVDDAIEKVREVQPDVVLMDVGLGQSTTLYLTAMARAESPRVKVILMGLLSIEQNVDDYVAAGVSGFLMKDASFEDCFLTIRTVCNENDVLVKSSTPARLVPSARSELMPGTRIREGVHLTTRECDVVELLSRGHSNREIAAELNIALHTVKSHVHNVLEKLELRSRLQVAAFSHSVGGVTNVRGVLQRA